MLVLEPIFEADLPPEIYAYRAGRNAQQAVVDVEERQFVASERYTIADILALVTVNFATRINLAIPEDCSHLRRWHESVSARPSAAA